MDNFTLLPNFAGTQGANTASLPTDNSPVDAYLQAHRQKFEEQQAQYAKEQKDIQDKIAATNFDTKGVIPQDQPIINGKITDYINWVKENPDAIIPHADNMDKYLEGRKMYSDIDQLVDKSKLDYEIYNKQNDFAVVHPELGQQVSKLSEFLNTPVDQRTWKGWDAVPPKFNYLAMLTKAKDLLVKQQEVGSPKNIGGTGLVSIPTTTTNTDESVKNALGSIYDTDPTAQAEFPNKDQFISTWTPTLKQLGGGTEQKVQGVNYAPVGNSQDAKDTPTWLIDGVMQLKSGGTGGFAPLKSGDKLPASAIFKNLSFGDDYIDQVVVKDGKVGVVLQKDYNSSTGYAKPRPVANVWHELIVPYVNANYGTNADKKLEELKDYAIKNGTAGELGIPTGTNTTTPKTNTGAFDNF